jgi:two-component system C4-dicarboxylate transport sensor histidine kinase DctB
MGDRDLTAPLGRPRLAHLNRVATTARLVAGLAHELNNTLQVVGGLVELLIDRTDLPEEAISRLEKIGGQADKATTAIRQVLGYTRETTTSEAAVIDLSSVVDSVVALRRYQLGRLGISVTVDRPASTVCRVHGNERELAQAILNLVINAEEALAGQPRRLLRLGLTRAGRAIQVQVEDSGHGVSAEIQKRIFEPFFTTRLTDRSMGLGLCVSQALVEASGGRLWLATTAPGATFVVELPAADAAADGGSDGDGRF